MVFGEHTAYGQPFASAHGLLVRSCGFAFLGPFGAPPLAPLIGACALDAADRAACWLQYVRAWWLCSQDSQMVGIIDFGFVMGTSSCHIVIVD